jgi:hypothetical protein
LGLRGGIRRWGKPRDSELCELYCLTIIVGWSHRGSDIDGTRVAGGDSRSTLYTGFWWGQQKYAVYRVLMGTAEIRCI